MAGKSIARKEQKPAQDVLEVTTAKVKHTHLPTAVETIVEIMESSDNERLRFEAARWIAERYMAKAAHLNIGGAGDAMARAAETMAKVLQDVLRDGRNLPEPIEADYRELEREVGDAIVIGPNS